MFVFGLSAFSLGSSLSCMDVGAILFFHCFASPLLESWNLERLEAHTVPVILMQLTECQHCVGLTLLLSFSHFPSPTRAIRNLYMRFNAALELARRAEYLPFWVSDYASE